MTVTLLSSTRMLAGWRGLLSRNVAQARQVLRNLVPKRLTFTPKEDEGERFYVF